MIVIGGESICVIDTNFLWVDMDNYSGQRVTFTRMSGSQKSVQGLTDVIGIFELFFDKCVGTENCGWDQSLCTAIQRL
jgi:hypothetical protein